MALQFPVPSGPAVYSSTMEYFRGADLASASVHVDPSRSPECPNMIRGDEVGKVRKRTGWYTFHTFESGKAINGVWILRGSSLASTDWPDGQMLVHVGTSLYAQDNPDEQGPADEPATLAAIIGGPDVPEIPSGGKDEPVAPRPPIGIADVIGWRKVADGLANVRSWGVQFGGKFLLLDGQTIWVWDGISLQNITQLATAPTVIISASPSGQGGVQLNPFNLLSDI